MNKKIFKTNPGKMVEPSNTTNRAGGQAYKMSDEQTLVQLAVTGCFNNTFYASAEEQLDEVMKLTNAVHPEFLAKVAIYARQKGYMKDMPAYLTASLANKDVSLMKAVFPKVINNGLMVKRFAHIIRTGVVGRKSFGTAVRNTIRNWMDERSDDQLFKDSVGGDVKMADLIKMIHPKPSTKSRNALYAYLLGKEYKAKDLPTLVKKYEQFKDGKTTEVPDVPFQFLTSLDIGQDTWKEIARNAPWHMTRMNLNTFERHGVFSDKYLTKLIVERLRNPELIKQAKVFPYQLMAAFMMTFDNEKIPREVVNALQDAMEIAVSNVTISGERTIHVFPDVSGSMSSPITGSREGSSSKIRCIDVAALVAAICMRNNKNTTVIPFEGRVVPVMLNSRDSIMTNANKLSRVGGGSTNCSAPLKLLNEEKWSSDLLIYVSDNESWIDSVSKSLYRNGTATMQEWERFKVKNPKAKMVCIDLVPNSYSHASTNNKDILNIGGFSDNVFDIINKFVNNELDSKQLVGEIKDIKL